MASKPEKSIEITVVEVTRGFIVNSWDSVDGNRQYACVSLLEARGLVNSLLTNTFMGPPPVQEQ
jgi:hypothetical protein